MHRASTLCLITLTCLLASRSATAGYIGVEFIPQGTQTLSDSRVVDVYHWYVVFDEASTLLYMFNLEATFRNNLYQFTTPPFNPAHDATPPNSGFFSFEPDLQWDSYFTIGDMDSADGSDISRDPAFAVGADTITGGWFDSNPTTPDGATDINNKVFIGQVSLLRGTGKGGGHTGQGVLSMTYRDFSGAAVQTTSIPFPFPTPGTGIALLAGLGLTSRRRR